MLHTHILEAGTLELLKSLQSKEYLQDFSLVGGTALALYMEHRKSIDLDLFTSMDFDVSLLVEAIQQDYQIEVFQIARNTLKGNIQGVNVGLIAHRYPLLQDPVVDDGIRL